MKDETPLTVGDLKRHLSNLDDECIIHFSPIGGIEPIFYRLKNWLIEDETNKIKEVVFEFSER